MRIVFWGTPDFACEILHALIDQGHELAAAVCQPDRPRGRGRKLASPPTREAACTCGIPALQPENPDDPAFVAELAALRADAFVVVAYGRILSAKVLSLPSKGCINVHYSLLPKYRGAAPVNHAIMQGETVTGVTVMYMSERMDTGDIILQREVPIRGEDTAGNLLSDLTDEGGGALADALELVAQERAPRIPQDESEATYAPALRKADGAINWSIPARRTVDFVRGLNPWPVAFTSFRGERLCVLKMRAEKDFSGEEGSPGEVVELDPDSGVLVQTGEGVASLVSVHPPGRSAMSSAAFMHGRRILVGERFG